MKCGCEAEDGIFSNSPIIQDDDCLLPEALEIIKALLFSSSWMHTPANQQAEAFLAKVRENQ